MNIIALGRSEFLYDTIELFLKKGYRISLIGTCNESDILQKTASDFEFLAKKYDIPFFNSAKINSPEIINLIKSFKPDIAISSHWLTIMKSKILSCFKYGVINCHWGDLPRYKGNAVPNWSILNGEKEMCVCFHYMNEELDSGPILKKYFFPISDKTTLSDIYNHLWANIPFWFLEVFEGIKKGEILPVPQLNDPVKTLRCYPRIPSDSMIDWNKSALAIDRLIRASCYPLPGAYTCLKGNVLRILKAHIEYPSFQYCGIPGQVAEICYKTGEVSVITGDNFIILEEVQLENESTTVPAKIIKSSRLRLGA